MHFKRLPGLEGKTREESLARNLGDPIGRLIKKKERAGKQTLGIHNQ